MTKKIYNQQKVQSTEASSGSQTDTGLFVYRGFNSRNIKGGFKENDIDLIKRDLLNHFYIRRGEKLENPDFGTVIWDLIFEPMTEQNMRIINEDVARIINRDPRTSPKNLKIDATEHGIRIEIDLTYVPFDVTEKLTLDFDRTAVPQTN